MIYLTVKEVADLKGCSERSVQFCVSNGTINAKIDTTQNNRKKFTIPISELSTHEQLKYYKSHNIEIPEELLAGRKPKAQHPHKEFDEFTAEQREEIAEWIRIIKAWDEYCAKSKLQKVPATEKFVQLQKIANPELNISKGILYRKKAALKADDLAGLIDNRGSWKKGTSSIPDEVWQLFQSYFLKQSQFSVQYCYELTESALIKNAPQFLPLPKCSSFYRKVKTIPYPLMVLGREGEKAFYDKCSGYIRRTYDEMRSNEWWVADTHTLDVMTQNENGKTHRLYLTAFFDARSWIFVGCHISESVSSQSTLIALRKAILGYGIPENLLVDNGHEYLTFDVGGLGHRQKKSTKDKFAPPPVFERLGIKMQNALVTNAQAKIIERRFRDVKDRLSRLFPTYTGGNVVERPEQLKKNIKNKSNIPVDTEFIQQVEDILNYYFNEQPYGGSVTEDKGKTRMQVYKENLVEKRIASEQDLNLMLMRSTRSQKVGKRGVHLKVNGYQIDYCNDELKSNYFGKSVYLRYDPESFNYVRVYDLDDNYIMTVPAANDTVLKYGDSKEKVSAAIKKTRNFKKVTREALAASTFTALGTDTALELVLAAAEENKAKAEEINPKVISVHRADEEPAEMQMAVGQNNIVKIDKAKMIRNLEQRQKEE